MKDQAIFDRGRLIISASLCLVIGLSAACSIPTLETDSCTAARPLIREFYSFHFANELELSAESLQKRERFISPGLIEKLKQMPEGSDPFTVGDAPFPRAFRAGACREIAPDRVEFEVLVFWRDDTAAEQRMIKTELLDLDGKWLVDRITN